MTSTTRSIPNNNFYQEEVIYRTFEFQSFDKGFTIELDVYPKESLKDKLRGILKEDFEVELIDAEIK